jgi:RsiW-degrading membrane proteinase PrsW (M82 family)
MAMIPGVVEEVVKLMAVFILAWRVREFDERADGIVYTVVIGLGFAALENLLYVTGGTMVGFMRALTAVPMHAILGAIMGFYIGKAKFAPKKKKKWLILTGLLFAIIIHTAYDLMFFASKGNTSLGLIGILIAIVMVIIGIFVSFKLMNILVEEDKKMYALQKMEALMSTDRLAITENKNNFQNKNNS